jgi:phosphinothricin acetyltransferase
MLYLRPAIPEDASAILEIYSPYVLNTTISFESEIPSVPDMQLRIEKCTTRYPWLVCYVGDMMAGYAYASLHRERAAYQWTCESSVYIHDRFKGKGIAKGMYEALFHLLKIQGIINAYAGITLPNNPSVLFHEKCGFVHFATYEHIGYKLGRWQNVGWWRLRINELETKPPPPVLFSQLDRGIVNQLLNNASAELQSRFISRTG